MNFSAWIQVLSDPSTASILMLTLKVSAFTLVCHGLLGISLAWALSHHHWPLRRLLDTLVTLLLIMPPMATGFFLLMALGRQGAIGRLLHDCLGVDLVFSVGGVVVSSFLAGLPLVVKPVQSALEDANVRWTEAARTLGKTEWQILIRVLLPNIRGAVLAGLILGLGRSMGEVGVTLMLGGNIVGRTVTASLEIYNAVMDAAPARAMVFAGLHSLMSGGLFITLQVLRHWRAPHAPHGWPAS